MAQVEGGGGAAGGAGAGAGAAGGGAGLGGGPPAPSQQGNNSSDEEQSGSSVPGKRKRKVKSLRPAQGGGGGGGGQVGEGSRKPRGRPPGSKNKPKPPIIITRDNGNAMRPHVLEVASGCDVGESVAAFSRRRQRGVCVMGGSGTVTNVTLRQASTPGATVTFHGRFEIISLSGSFLLPPSPMPTTGLTISLAGSAGQVLGGSVVGALLAASPVLVIATSFTGATYDRLPLDEEEPPQLLQGTASSAGAPVMQQPAPDIAGYNPDPLQRLYIVPQPNTNLSNQQPGSQLTTQEVLSQWATGSSHAQRPQPY